MGHDTKRQIVGDFAQDACLKFGHQEGAATSPWHHFAFKPCKEARSALPNNYSTIKELREHGSVVLFNCGCTLNKVVKQRDFVGPIVIGGIVVIAFVLFMGWYSQGLTPEQIESLKAKRDAIALPVAEPHKKKKWAQ